MSRPPGGGVPAEPSARHEIRVKGGLASRWSAWFEGLQVSSDESDHTVIAGPVADQAALHGLPAKIRDPGLPLGTQGTHPGWQHRAGGTRRRPAGAVRPTGPPRPARRTLASITRVQPDLEDVVLRLVEEGRQR